MIILHSDLNNFYASVECVLNPSLSDEYVAVCGSEEDRHGIVLAKNEKAKKCGVTTGETIWKAKQKCPRLITIMPHFDKYQIYSEAVKKIYSEYTDKIEAFGPDECWLDVSASTRLFGSGEEIANKIRQKVKKETGLTVSVGVSFNKIFAKLGSDMKKPDAVTVIEKENFKEKVWGLDVGSLMGVGPSYRKKLMQYKIMTIGDLANTPPEFLKRIFGKNGLWMWMCANGKDCSLVSHMNYHALAKSIGRGVTLRENLEDKEMVRRVIYKLSLEIEKTLREEKLLAKSVSVAIKNNFLETKQFCQSVPFPTHSAYEIALSAFELFDKKYKGVVCIRSVSVRVTNLTDENMPIQTSFFDERTGLEKKEIFEKTFCDLKRKYGSEIIKYGSLMGDLKIPKNAPPKPSLPSFR